MRYYAPHFVVRTHLRGDGGGGGQAKTIIKNSHPLGGVGAIPNTFLLWQSRIDRVYVTIFKTEGTKVKRERRPKGSSILLFSAGRSIASSPPCFVILGQPLPVMMQQVRGKGGAIEAEGRGGGWPYLHQAALWQCRPSCHPGQDFDGTFRRSETKFARG